jgi:hypothetical protein
VFVSADGNWKIEDDGMWVDYEGLVVELRYSVSVHDNPIVSIDKTVQ